MTDYLAKIRTTLASRDGVTPPTTQQLAAADVYARAAQAHALDRIADALEVLAADGAVPRTAVRPAIRHTV